MKQQIGPVVKWVGGKRQLLSDILPYIEHTHFHTYIEPFIGGGSRTIGSAAGEGYYQ